ncbi:tRNA-5-taurinomethyluridine 2-sulfurtransferase [Malassezia vespertilionis]|uniref:tRNA-5-taurinomethyluridine 2-sulfurtransferase n=1 Tax=Malassezia vespertilionis TaxID=2020962 RepID=UPI0024B24D80|nr:tRNA-5-taurinomethyluridine 2-sulfurtransferase [Malassezia vespertilionis]WFD08440.1 tRNA-5-taurinomethyluridine 2-sulfurtransferase [Malassezia vespertilionis]
MTRVPQCLRRFSTRVRRGDTVTLAMSGGVDSSVAAALLAREDVDLRAVYMRNWSSLDESGAMQPGSGGAMGCAWQEEWNDVQNVCKHLGNIPVELVDLSREYWHDVFAPALAQWSDGATPNPDVACNRSIKFGTLMERMRIGPNAWLATGHYARIAWRADAEMHSSAYIRRALDASKDQSYYLSSVPSERVAQSIFPLGDLTKAHVRNMARAFALPTAERRESMGLCFVGERGKSTHGFARFLGGYVEGTAGPLLDEHGDYIGKHDGLHTFTIGQRARVSGCKERYFVARKHLDTNAITVVPRATHPMLQCSALETEPFVWAASAPSLPCALQAQVRYRQAAETCKVYAAGHGVRVEFATPVLAVAPGQVVALYDGDLCLGSGVIGRVDTLA